MVLQFPENTSSSKKSISILMMITPVWTSQTQTEAIALLGTEVSVDADTGKTTN